MGDSFMNKGIDYKKKKWQSLRSSILRRDKYQCQYYKRFGKNVEAEHVHHIYPVEFYPEYAFCPWNLISLSQKAHNLMHVRGSHELTTEGIALQHKIKNQKEEFDRKMQVTAPIRTYI